MKLTFEQKWQKAKRTKKRKMLLDVWSAIIHARDEVCQYCGKGGLTNAHHIFSKSSDCVAFDLNNGILLCPGHHTLNSNFSAHKAPRAFFSWLENRMGKEWVDNLEIKSSGICKWNYDDVLKGLLVVCNEYNIDIELIKH